MALICILFNFDCKEMINHGSSFILTLPSHDLVILNQHFFTSYEVSSWNSTINWLKKKFELVSIPSENKVIFSSPYCHKQQSNIWNCNKTCNKKPLLMIIPNQIWRQRLVRTISLFWQSQRSWHQTWFK